MVRNKWSKPKPLWVKAHILIYNNIVNYAALKKLFRHLLRALQLHQSIKLFKNSSPSLSQIEIPTHSIGLFKNTCIVPYKKREIYRAGVTCKCKLVCCTSCTNILKRNSYKCVIKQAKPNLVSNLVCKANLPFNILTSFSWKRWLQIH